MSTSPLRQSNLTEDQLRKMRTLVKQFAVDPDRIYWLGGPDPWLPADVLCGIARLSGNFKSIEEWHDKFVPERKQVIYRARVIDLDGHEYSRSGAAMINEQLPEMEKGEVADEDQLAASRALRSTLDLAGFDPFKSNSVIRMVEDEGTAARTPLEKTVAEVSARANDMARIHILAEDAGLIVRSPTGPKDQSPYRKWLMDNYKVTSAVELNETERASVIAALENKARELA